MERDREKPSTGVLREGENITIRHEDEEIVLNRANPTVTRSTLNPLKIAG